MIRRQQLVFGVMLAIILLSGMAWAKAEAEKPGPVLTAAIDKDTVQVGEMVALTLKFRIPQGSRIPENPAIRGVEGLTIVEQAVAGDQIKIKFLVDRLGHWESEPIRLPYLDKEGREQTVQTDPVSITVFSNLGEKPEEAELKPLQDIVPTDRKWTTYLYGVLAAAVFFLGIAVLIRWYRKKHPHARLSEVLEPPHVKAGKEIDQLQSLKLYETGEVKAFYFIFSKILRRYMESIRRFPATGYTTEEITRHVGHSRQDGKILPLLRGADLVKFADAIPAPAHKEDDVRTALAYIRETAPVAEEVHSSPILRKASR